MNKQFNINILNKNSLNEVISRGRTKKDKRIVLHVALISGKEMQNKTADRLEMLKTLINKSLDIKDYNNFNKYTKEYNKLRGDM